MGFESFGNYENLGSNEQTETQKYDLSLLNATQDKIESEARSYVLREQENGRDVTEITGNINTLVERQRSENEAIETQIQSETRENIDKEACIQEAKTQIYERCGISENQNANSSCENFMKGCIDEAVIGNYDMAIEIINTKGQVVLDALKQLMSWDGLKQMAEALGESIWDLWNGDAYDKGKAIVALGLLSTGIGYVGKKAVQLGMKQISRLRVNTEKVVSSPEIQKTVKNIRSQVDDIVPKQEFYGESAIRESLPKEIRDVELDLEHYNTDIKMKGLKDRLGLPESASLEEVDLSYRLKMKEALDEYREKGRENLMKIGNELVEDLQAKGIDNPALEIRNEIRRLKALQKDEDIMIVTGFDEVNSLDIQKGGLKSPYQLHDNPFGARQQYAKLRESTDKGLNIYGLDPKYATMVVEKKDFQFLQENYGYNQYVQHSFDDLSGRAGTTYYDSILTSRFNGNGLDSQMVDFDYILEAQALLNIEKRYSVGNLSELKSRSIVENGFKEGNKNRQMIESIQPFIEVQIFGKTAPNIK